jgi:RNA polymerase sigma factor (sigma-70 family)
MSSFVLSNPVKDRRKQPSDEELVRACRRGEAAAWGVLVNRYQRLIYTIPRRARLDEDRAGEVFQRTFASLLEQLERIEQPQRIRAWLVTTARRETWRLLRQQKNEQLFSDTSDPHGADNHESLPDDGPLPDEELERLEEQHLIHIAISAIDERCRRLLTLLFYCPEPPPYSEVAAALDMPEGSLGPTRARCLNKMRRLLEAFGF